MEWNELCFGIRSIHFIFFQRSFLWSKFFLFPVYLVHVRIKVGTFVAFQPSFSMQSNLGSSLMKGSPQFIAPSQRQRLVIFR